MNSIMTGLLSVTSSDFVIRKLSQTDKIISLLLITILISTPYLLVY